jgi:hypothetical protein
VPKDTLEIIVMNNRRIPSQEHLEGRAYDEAPEPASPRPVVPVPQACELILVLLVAVSIAAMAAADRVGRIAGHHAVAGQRQSLGPIPGRSTGVAVEHVEDAEDRCPATVRYARPIPSLLRQVNHYVMLSQARRTLARAAKATDRRIRVFEVRLASNRTIYEREKSITLASVAARYGGNQRGVRDQEKSPLVFAHDWHYRRRRGLINIVDLVVPEAAA